MTFIFRNRTIFWDISKWNRRQKKWDGESITQKLKTALICFQNILFKHPKLRIMT